MFRLIEDFDKIKDMFPNSECCYRFAKDDKTIGAAAINKAEEDNVYIFIKKDYRGNGYGKILFSNIIEELKQKNYSKVIVCFDKNNIQMTKIINDNNGLHISTDKEIVKYLIPID